MKSVLKHILILIVIIPTLALTIIKVLTEIIWVLSSEFKDDFNEFIEEE